MNRFSVTIGVAPYYGDGERIEVSATVDTRGGYAVLPASLLTRLGIRPTAERAFRFADGRVEKRGMGYGRIDYNGEEFICPIIFGPEGQYLLGHIALAICSLEADPENRRLVPMAPQARYI